MGVDIPRIFPKSSNKHWIGQNNRLVHSPNFQGPFAASQHCNAAATLNQNSHNNRGGMAGQLGNRFRREIEAGVLSLACGGCSVTLNVHSFYRAMCSK